MRTWKVSVVGALLFALSAALAAQGPDPQAAAAAIMRADADFARTVADKDRARFLTFVAEATTFNGGAPDELHGRDAVMKQWATFFEPDGPSLSWTPIKGEVLATGDIGWTTGQSVFRQKGPDGKTTERHGRYLTVWRKQADGRWQVVFDTGSNMPN